MTFRGRILLSNLAMVLVPLALVILLNAVMVSFVQEGNTGPILRISWPWQSASSRRPLPTRQMLALTQSTLRRINVETLGHPEQWTDPAFWKRIDQALTHSDAGLAVRQGTEFIFVGRELGQGVALDTLPPWGDLDGTYTSTAGGDRGYRLLGQWDFMPVSGPPLSVFLLWVTEPWNNAVETLSTVLLGAFFLSTLGVGLLLAWLFGRSLLVPLRTLQSAAARIASGDLSPTSVPRRRDELAPLIEAFEAMRRKLEENSHLRDRYEADRRDMIAHIAHDLKTPVTAINGYVHGILDGVAATPEKQRQYLEVIAAKARDLDRRTDELFFFSGLDLGTLPYEFQNFDLGDFLADLWDDFIVEYGPQGLSGPRPEVPPGPLPVRGDPARLRRLFANLADNTVKFRRGDRVTWTWLVNRRDGVYRIELQDDGAGIDAEALPHVFERFYRADRSRTSQVPGTGLGLAIVRRIALDHAGTVRASSGPGAGTTIVVELPQP